MSILARFSKFGKHQMVPFFTENRDESCKSVLRESDCLLYVNGTDVTGMDPTEVLNKYSEDSCPCATFSFLSDVNCIFSDPVTAISLGLAPVLKQMIERQYINANDVFQSEWDPTDGADAIKQPLLYHSMVNSQDTSCFDYLMSLADINCSIDYHSINGRGINLLFVCLESCSFKFSRYALKVILPHPMAPDINARDGNGSTLLHYLCEECCDHVEVNQLGFLLHYGADPSIKNEEGHLPIDIIYNNYWDCDEDDDDFIGEETKKAAREMVRLLQIPRGERDVSQPPITNFFKKRRLC